MEKNKKLYPKIENCFVMEQFLNEKCQKEKPNVIIEEKIDGSNFNFGFWNDEFVIFSRNRNITNENYFNKFKLDQIKEKEPQLRLYFEELKPQYLGLKSLIISGEILSSGKLAYNKNIKYLLEDSFYLFDIQLIWDDLKDETIYWMDRNEKEKFAKKFNFNITKLIDSLSFYEFLKIRFDIENLYIKDKKSFINKDINIEGVVIKFENTLGDKFKIVSEDFKEVKVIKENKHTDINNYIFKSFMTTARIEKFIQTLNDENLIDIDNISEKDYSIIFKNGFKLVNDIFEEQQQDIINNLKKSLNRKTPDIIKKYLNETKNSNH